MSSRDKVKRRSLLGSATSMFSGSSDSLDQWSDSEKKPGGVGSSPLLATPMVSPRQLFFKTKGNFEEKHFKLIYSAALGNLTLLKKYVEEEKIDPAVADYDQRTALHVASHEGHVQIIEYLVTKVQNINELDKFGLTPIRCAMNANHKACVDILRKNGGKTGTELSGEVSLGKTTLSKGVIENKLEKARLIFEHLDGYYENLVPVDGLHSFLETKGLFVDHSPTLMRQVKSITEDDQIHWSAFAKFLIEKENVLKRAVTDELIIPNWSNFCLHMNNIYWECMESEEGVCPEEFEFENLNQFGVTIVSVDGQIFEVGDNDNHTPMHALISPFLYAIDIEDHGYDKIHEKIGKEPSPLRFDEIGLNIKKKPQNPLIHSGSLVCAEFVLPNQNISSKFKYVSKRIADFVDGKIGFDNKRYLSSKEKKDKLSSLAYYIAANEGFSNSNTIENISDTVDFLLQLYALEMSILQIATATATLANSGVCPLTAKKAISKNANLKTIQMMHSCGMYDVSGEWACSVGLPSKSGLNGLTMIVVPGLCGIVINSPKVSKKTGNSIRAEAFAKKLTERYSWSAFDVLYSTKKQRLLQ